MTELIKVIVSIKDPFTLLAFFAVVLLIAFRTKTVPESVFRLVGQKISRDRFYVLLNRLLIYGFAVFLVLAAIAVVAQVLTYKTSAAVWSVEQLKGEITVSKASEAAAERALAEYQKAEGLSKDGKLSEAIASLEASVKAVPTATAREMLALLYHQAGNREAAGRLADQAVSEARDAGSPIEIVKAERTRERVTTRLQPVASGPCPAGAGLVGPKLNLPPGGDDFESAQLLIPCVYRGQFDVETKPNYYKVALRGGQTLRVVLRNRDVGSAGTSVNLHSPNGGHLNGWNIHGDSALAQPLVYKADEDGAAYIRLSGGVRGSALEVSVK